MSFFVKVDIIYPFFRVLPFFPRFTLFSAFYPFFRVLPFFPCFTLFSAFYPLFRVLPFFPRFTLFSVFYPLFRVLPSFPRFTLFSAFYPFFRVLPFFPRFTLFSAFYPLFRVLPFFPLPPFRHSVSAFYPYPPCNMLSHRDLTSGESSVSLHNFSEGMLFTTLDCFVVNWRNMISATSRILTRSLHGVTRPPLLRVLM